MYDSVAEAGLVIQYAPFFLLVVYPMFVSLFAEFLVFSLVLRAVFNVPQLVVR